MNGSLIVRVPRELAEGWTRGELRDPQLILSERAHSGEALFFVSLFGRGQWRELAPVFRELRGRIEVACFRTGHPVVEHYAAKLGARPVWRENAQQQRWWADEAAVSAWLRRFSRDAVESVPTVTGASSTECGSCQAGS